MASQATGSSKHVQPLPQECWRTMRRGCNMLKIWTGTRTKLKSSKLSRDKKTTLTKDQKQIIFNLKRKEKRVNISDITKILTCESDPEKFEVARNLFSLVACFAVVTSTTEEIFFAAASIDEANLWVNGLEYLIKNEAMKNIGEERQKQWLKNEFLKLTKNPNNFVKYVDLLSFFTSQGMSVDPSFVKKSLKKFNDEKNYTDDEITQEEFIEFLRNFLMREEFLNLFVQTSSNGSFMTAEDLEYFLTKRQGQSSTSRNDCLQLIKNYEVTQEGRENGELSIDGFIKYMSSKEGELFDPNHEKVYQDMTHPFAHYFIASSHNTYLSGDQLQGESSVDEYVKVLEEGCRCVELDCWDGDNDEPVVYHGHTLTSKILFKDVIKAVKNHAFKVSPYPVILNMENHCSVEIQKKMARYLVDILGDMLYKTPVGQNQANSATPEKFKYKIFVRGKKLKPEAEQSNEEFGMTDDDDDDSDDDEEEEKENHNQHHQNKSPTDSTDAKKKKKPPKPIAKEFSLLINYFVNTHFVSFEHSAEQGQFYQSSSFAEKKLQKFLERSPDAFVEYNTKQLSRIYPGGFRVDSSNYDPQDAWNVGCQIVALNHQTFCVPVQLHHGKFRQNGKSGYVLKPEFLRRPGTKFNPLDLSDPGNMARTLKINIISGYRLSPPPKKEPNKVKDNLDPYVEVEIHGVPADKYEFRTKTIKNNSYNPKWDEGFTKKIHVPDLALIRFCVYDEDVGFDDFIGQSTITFTSVRPGYRQIILLDKKGQPYTCGTLFVHVTISESDVIAASSTDIAFAAPGKSNSKSGCTIA